VKRIAPKLLLSLLAASLIGCAAAPVQPWERGFLARTDMRLDANPGVDKALGKTFAAKESSSGGAGVGGGGCGCN
jgi:hypothetical protein